VPRRWNTTLLYSTATAGVYSTVDFGPGGNLATIFAQQSAVNAPQWGANAPLMDSEVRQQSSLRRIGTV